MSVVSHLTNLLIARGAISFGTTYVCSGPPYRRPHQVVQLWTGDSTAENRQSPRGERWRRMIGQSQARFSAGVRCDTIRTGGNRDWIEDQAVGRLEEIRRLISNTANQICAQRSRIYSQKLELCPETQAVLWTGRCTWTYKCHVYACYRQTSKIREIERVNPCSRRA